MGFIEKLLNKFSSESMEETASQAHLRLMTGRTAQLNNKIDMYSIDYNRNIIDAYKKGYRQAIEEFTRALEHSNKEIYDKVKYDFKAKTCKSLEGIEFAQEVRTGDVCLSGKVVSETVTLDQYSISLTAFPRNKVISMLTIK